MTAPLQLTYSAVLIAVLAEQLGLPFPSLAFLVTAGALSAHGKMRIEMVVFLGVAGCLVADAMWFSLGRRWGSQVLRLLCRFASDPRTSRQNANEKFRRYGPPVLCVAKFLPGVNFVMPPLVGAEGVSLAVFIALDTLGCFLWSGFYTGLGYLFSNEVDVAIRWVKNFGALFGIVILGPLCVYAAWRGVVLLRMIRRLRLRRIGPAMLFRKLKSNTKTAVLDLLDFEGDSNSKNQEAIPGAFRVDPSRLQKSPHISVPEDVDVILYSSSGGDAVPARAAVGLQRIGVHNVWVLEGGLKAWREQGFPVAPSPELPELAAARVGVKLPHVSAAREASLDGAG
ncbi:MAG TPA: VTT domain-containing protein [Terriglobales bacterium]|nr:VTT domain-containing protein [Terriglobales bacterium]